MAIFCDVKQAADLFRVSVTMFYKLVREGVIPPPCKIGTRSLWLYSDIERAAHQIPQSKTGGGYVSNEDNPVLPIPTDRRVDPHFATRAGKRVIRSKAASRRGSSIPALCR